MVFNDLEKKRVIAYAYVLFNSAGPLRYELASEIIEKVFKIQFNDIPRYLKSNDYVRFAARFWECLCQARLKYGT